MDSIKKKLCTVLVIVELGFLFVSSDALCNHSLSPEERSDNVISSSSISEEQIVVEIRESVHVNSRKITLGEIADISAPVPLKRQLSSIYTGFAPLPGKTEVIEGRRLESKIKSSKFYSDDMKLMIPERIYIERASQELSSDDLQALYESYLSENIGGKDFEIRDFSVRGLNVYPEGNISISPPAVNSRELKGRVTLYVNISIDGKDYGRLSLSGWVDIFDEVLCMARSLSRGSVISAEDVTVQRLNTANIHGEYLKSPVDAVGKKVIRNIQSNRVVTANLLEEAALVHKGDTVKVVAARGNLSIVTLGVLKNDGKLNDTVEVQNISSGKVVNAIVTDKDSVKVFY